VLEAAPRGNLEVMRLFDDPMYVAMPVGHRLAGARSLSMASLASEPWMIATGRSCPDSMLLLRACHAAGFEPRIAFENDDYSAILGFVAAGVGVALVPDMIARGARDDVVLRALEPAAEPRPISAMLPGGYRSPATSALLDVLREVSEEWASSPAALAAA
jgi:DNA-binding transcriptional LysR family regulator